MEMSNCNDDLYLTITGLIRQDDYPYPMFHLRQGDREQVAILSRLPPSGVHGRVRPIDLFAEKFECCVEDNVALIP